jgi:thiol-disulfide isomerase/thioredoxin
MSPEPALPAPRPRARSGLRQLDRRTIGISVLIALIAALAAGLVASILLDGGTTSDANSNAIKVTPVAKVDPAKAVRTPVLDFDGQHTTLAAHVRKGRPTVVNFFSTTCTPCVTEMPALERVHRSHRDVSFVGIDVQDQVAPGRKLIKRTGITYEALRDPPGDLLQKLGGVGLPTTVLIDRNGRIVATHTGALTEQALVTLISQKLR